MRFHVTGSRGYIGKTVVAELLRRGHEVMDSGFEAVIHLGWSGLPNYESTRHYENVWPQVEQVRRWIFDGITNITVAGTCLEAVPNPPPYAKAKLALLVAAQALPMYLKWVRLHYVYGGVGERPERLVPQFQRAVRLNQPTFSVIDGEREFMHVETVARHLINIALQTEVTGVIDCCTGAPTPVADFLETLKRDPAMQILKDYPMASYEPRVIAGDPTKLNSIP